jgi:hypothetical protein
MTPSGLYGQTNGMPIVRMSVWPSTGDELLPVDVLQGEFVHRVDVSPACTLVIWCGPSMPWKILRASAAACGSATWWWPR